MSTVPVTYLNISCYEKRNHFPVTRGSCDNNSQSCQHLYYEQQLLMSTHTQSQPHKQSGYFKYYMYLYLELGYLNATIQ